MGATTGIQWTDSTFNPWYGCTKVGPGCDHCYAEARMDTRLKRVNWGPGNPRRRTKTWGDPVRWNKGPFFQCVECGWRGDEKERGRLPYDPETDTRPLKGCPVCHGYDFRAARRRVFCASLADVFDNEVDPVWRADLFRLIHDTPNLDWLVLTKRIGNVLGMVPTSWLQSWPTHVHMGATIVNQPEADRDIIKLLRIPASVRFLSIEPMLGAVDLARVRGEPHSKPFSVIDNKSPQGWVRCVTHAPGHCLGNCHGRLPALSWVIAGGESGTHARPAHPDWFRSLRDQCAAAGVPFFFKQWGEWSDPDAIAAFGKAHHGWWEEDGEDGGVRRHEWQDSPLLSQRTQVFRVGKKAAGRLLDGIEHNGFPTPTTK